jgi:hypothetical protein
MGALLMERLQFIKGIDPVADAFDSTQYSDVVDMGEFEKIVFAVIVGVGATGTSTLTVQACDDTTPSNRTAVPFRYRQILTGDTEGALTAAAAAGFTTTAGSSKIVLVEVTESDLADTNYRYCQLKAVEVVNSPVLAGVLILGEKKRQSSSAAASAID